MEIAEKPRWAQIADTMRTMEPDNVLTYASVMAKFPGIEFDFLRQDVLRAIREVEETDQRTFEVVRDEGYRMVRAEEHFRLARERGKRARRQITRGLSITTNVRKDELTQEERLRAERQAFNFKNLEDAVKSVNRRKNRVTVAVEKVKDETIKIVS